MEQNNDKKHPLRNNYCFWRATDFGTTKEEYEGNLQNLGVCKTVEDFWRLYCSLPVIGTENATNYSFFKEGIEPLWEDPENQKGGRTILTLVENDLTPYLWETLLLTTIGEQFNVGKEICGVSVTMKKDSTTIVVWNKTATNQRVINQIEAVLRTVWSAPPYVHLSYKRTFKVKNNETKNEKEDRQSHEDQSKPAKKEVSNRFAFLEDEN